MLHLESRKKNLLLQVQDLKLSFKTSKSKDYMIARLIEDYNEACPVNINSKSNGVLDFLSVFEIMKKLGFIRQKDKISQADINSDKALFMDFWQYLEAHKKNSITRNLLLAYLLAVEGFSVRSVLKSKSLKSLFEASKLSLILFKDLTL
jgi:hypothetical protein